jgi:hypothetical protein
MSFRQYLLMFAAYGILTLPIMAKESPQTAGLEEIFFEPKAFFLSSLNETQTVALTGRYADGNLRDLTRQAKLSIKDTEIAELGSDGRLISKAPGSTNLQASVAGHTTSALVVIRAAQETRAMDFATDIAPILSRYGCNASGCHGALNGQPGFKLSLFGYEPDADYEAIVKANEGRRVQSQKP